MSPLEIALVLAAAAAGAIVQGSVGIGLGLVASPILISIDARFAPGPLLVGGLVVGARHMIAEWEHLDRPALRHAFSGLPVGAVGAVLVLRLLPERLLSAGIGLMVCVSAAALLRGFTLNRTLWSDRSTGAAAAFTSIAAALPGPPLVIGFHDLRPGALRSTISAFITVISVVAMVSLASIGRFGTHEIKLLALMLPGLLVGMVCSRWTRPLLDRDWFRPAVLVLAFAGGAVLVLRQL